MSCFAVRLMTCHRVPMSSNVHRSPRATRPDSHFCRAFKDGQTVTDPAEKENIGMSYQIWTLSLTLLAPDIIDAMLEGR